MGRASRLDAFSAYPYQTRLPGRAPGGTTGSPEVCPARSSRTSAGSPQISNAHNRSRATLIGEQPNPWDLLQPRDVTSRHRGAKPLRRSELLGGISLLSPEYLLSFERRPFHSAPPDHYAPVSCLFGLSASQSSPLLPLHSQAGYQSARGDLWKPPLRFWRRPPQSNYPPSTVRVHNALVTRHAKARISTSAPRRLAPPHHSLRTILHITGPVTMLSCSKGSRGLSVPLRVIGIITPFVQVGTYPTRNFATLGPL